LLEERVKTGSADLPLHGGRVPAWLHQRMAKLGRLIVETITLEYSRAEVLRRLSHPFWFQSFGAVMGMDWHSSGITTSVIGALKRGLEPVSDELGLYVCGGRGRHSRRTPAELIAVGERCGVDGAALAAKSRLTAKVDSAAVQDGFELYLHSFIVSAEGEWTVVQQGMNGDRRQARRYHWLSEGLESFVDSPHAAMEGENQGTIINLADRRAERSRQAQLELLGDLPPERILRELGALRRAARREARRADKADKADKAAGQGGERGQGGHAMEQTAISLVLPAHHDVRETDVVIRRLHGALAAAKERGPKDFTELLSTPGVGMRTVAALAQVAEVVHGAPNRFSDPARFAYAHGGKDGHPFPVPLKVYDHTIATLRRAVERAKRLGQDDKLSAIKRLDQASRRAEAAGATGESWSQIVARERRESYRYGGMTVMGPAKPPAVQGPAKPPAKPPAKARAAATERARDQLDLPGVRKRSR
jgi:hypothetical protein